MHTLLILSLNTPFSLSSSRYNSQSGTVCNSPQLLHTGFLCSWYLRGPPGCETMGSQPHLSQTLFPSGQYLLNCCSSVCVCVPLDQTHSLCLMVRLASFILRPYSLPVSLGQPHFLCLLVRLTFSAFGQTHSPCL